MSTLKIARHIPYRQLVMYALIGVLSNSLGYGAYLLLNMLGWTPKWSMTALYIAGASVSFAGNRKLTFSSQRGGWDSGRRFAIAHLGGYAINYMILAVFVDHLGYPHQWVQALAVVLIAGYLFLTLKFFVFKATL